MTNIPNPPNGLASLLQWARDLTSALRDELDQVRTPNTLLSVGSRGTGRTAYGGGDGGSRDVANGLAEQWDVTHDYVAGDMAFDFLDAACDTGTKAGLYQAQVDVSAGGDHPSINSDWLCIANLHLKKVTMASGTHRVIFDAGRDGSDDASIIVKHDTASDTTLCCKLKIADLAAISGAGDTEIKFREWDVCVDGASAKAIFLSSDSY